MKEVNVLFLFFKSWFLNAFQVEEAARQANAHSFISQFEEGYNTLVGERGVRLSGGQKQRVFVLIHLFLLCRMSTNNFERDP